MKQEKDGELHVMKDEHVSERLAGTIAENLYIDDTNPIEEMEAKIKRHRKWFWKSIILSIAMVLLIGAGTYMLITIQTYTKVSVNTSIPMTGNDNGKYLGFLDGVLRYGKDGVALVNQNGKEEWNQSNQMKSPVADICKEAAVVADKGGNSILVFQKKGLKGEIQTTLPIEQVAVSAQGIVGAVLKDDVSPRVVCYDAAGNLLAEQKVSVSGTGYPVGIDISEDGSHLIVSYLHVKDGVMNSTIAYYHFSDKAGEGTEQKIEGDVYQDEIVPAVFYMNSQISAAVSDKTLLIYKGDKNPKISKKLEIGKTIKSVFYSEKYIGFILKNQEKSGYELRLYTTEGKVALSKNIDEAYANVKVVGEQVIMFEGKNCSVYTRNGVHKFQGEFDAEVQEIVPIFGVNKYMVMSAEGMKQVRFVK